MSLHWSIARPIFVISCSLLILSGCLIEVDPEQLDAVRSDLGPSQKAVKNGLYRFVDAGEDNPAPENAIYLQFRWSDDDDTYEGVAYRFRFFEADVADYLVEIESGGTALSDDGSVFALAWIEHGDRLVMQLLTCEAYQAAANEDQDCTFSDSARFIEAVTLASQAEDLPTTKGELVFDLPASD